jgi:tetratricopeptide (TPR) repeat protein
VAGVGNLYTREFFNECAQRLNPGGMIAQWFHLYEMDDETFQLVLKTFHTTFRSVTIWQWENDVFLIGTDASLELDYASLQKKFNVEAVRNDFKRIRISEPVVLLSLQAISESQISEYEGFGSMNTEDLPHLEYWAPKAFFVNKGVTHFLEHDERLREGKGTILLEKYRRQFGITDEQKRSIGLYHTTSDRGHAFFAYALLREYHTKHPEDVSIVEPLADISVRLGRRTEAMQYLEQLAKSRNNDPVVLDKYALQKYRDGSPTLTTLTPVVDNVAEQLLKRCIELTADTVDRYRIHLGMLYFDYHDYKNSIENYQRALEIREQHMATEVSQEDLLFFYAKALDRIGNYKKGIAYALQSLSINPENEEAKDLAYEMFMKMKSTSPPRTK